MKRNILAIAMTLIMAITVFSQESKGTRKASEVLENIVAKAMEKKIPLEIYPPGYLDQLYSMGDEEMPEAKMEKASSLQKSSSGMSMQRLFNPATQKFQVVDLGTLGGSVSYAYDINNNGQIVGYGSIGALLWSNNGLATDLGTNPLRANAISDNGQVVGEPAFMWSNGIIHNLTIPGYGSFPQDINDKGEVVGYITSFLSYHFGRFWSGNESYPLTDTNSNLSLTDACGINEAGQIVGFGNLLGWTRAMLWSDGSIEEIGTLGGSQSRAYNINDEGQIVGEANTVGGATHAFLWSNGTMQDLGTLAGTTTSRARGVNNSGQVVGSSSARAFLWSGGVMYDLVTLLMDTNSGWRLDNAMSINDSGQIVGYGRNSSNQIRAFLLNPLPEGYTETLDTQLPKLVFGNYPTKGAGKDSLVLVTHGWQLKLPFGSLPDLSWLGSMSNNINGYLINQALTNWQVYGYKWITNAWKLKAPDALVNAQQEGYNLGSVIATQGWSHIHLIGHSAGAQVVQKACERIKELSPGITVHSTFLDPYTGEDRAGITNYGKGANWADNYFAHDILTRSATEGCLSNAYNVDVKQLDPFKFQVSTFPSKLGEPLIVCTKSATSHAWPRLFYENTITGNVTTNYEGFGFPLSKEGGNWDFVIASCTNGNVPAHLLGTIECAEDIPNTPITWPKWSVDFDTAPAVQSPTGSTLKGNGWLKFTPGSPVWRGTVVNPTNPVNTVSFDMVFLGTNGSSGLFSVYWDTNVIATIDESSVAPGFQHYSLSFPQAQGNGAYILGFRLDPYTNAHSSVVITNVALTQIGVSQPFSLSVVTNSSNGVIYELKGESGFNYGVQASTNLTDWSEIAQLVNTNGTVRFYDPNTATVPMKFYRATVPAN